MIDRKAAAVAGHRGDLTTAKAALQADDPAVRATALGALARLGALDADCLDVALGDPDPQVRRRAAALAATTPDADVSAVLDDADPFVVEAAVWTLGERQRVTDAELQRVVTIAGDDDVDPLVREAAVAALGAIGDVRGLDAVLAACTARPAIRRRAVIALAAFVDPDEPRLGEVRAALEAGSADRDWQVRQAAEDVLAAISDD